MLRRLICTQNSLEHSIAGNSQGQRLFQLRVLLSNLMVICVGLNKLYYQKISLPHTHTHPTRTPPPHPHPLIVFCYVTTQLESLSLPNRKYLYALTEANSLLTSFSRGRCVLFLSLSLSLSLSVCSGFKAGRGSQTVIHFTCPGFRSYVFVSDRQTDRQTDGQTPCVYVCVCMHTCM